MVKKINRIPTGISGLDKFIEGGFLENSVNLVSGNTGAGKTIFSMQFLKEGAEDGKKVLYLSTEESIENLKDGFRLFGWNLDKLNNFRFYFLTPADLEKEWESLVYNVIEKENVKRLVIDSVSLIGLYYKDEYSIRKYLYELVGSLKKRKVTTILTSEIPERDKGSLSRYGVEEFICDGIIQLQFTGMGSKFERGLIIRKMRWTNHTQDMHPFKITKEKGIVLGG
ncbi:MAG: hypothetical protein B6U88_00785 [Candidatus Aenigmarchaeota archaeon ex4484_56]|nr:MAG: hypothetical protein B6U88_00785 [Candidatus Aenigmarchaeota archaeon ex4484_56]